MYLYIFGFVNNFKGKTPNTPGRWLCFPKHLGSGSLWQKSGIGNIGRGRQSTMELHHAKCFSFVDNTYVSSSDNDEDVLVTTEPIPVIFHQIATGNSMSGEFSQIQNFGGNLRCCLHLEGDMMLNCSAVQLAIFSGLVIVNCPTLQNRKNENTSFGDHYHCVWNVFFASNVLQPVLEQFPLTRDA